MGRSVGAVALSLPLTAKYNIKETAEVAVRERKHNQIGHIREDQSASPITVGFCVAVRDDRTDAFKDHIVCRVPSLPQDR